MGLKTRILLTVLIGTFAAATLAELEMGGSNQTEGVFHNRYAETGSRGSFFMWQLERLWRGLPRNTSRPIEPVQPDLKFLGENTNQTSVSWIGHSTLLLQLDGLNILTDPMFSEYASPFPPLGPKRHQPPGIALKDLPHVDIVLISHNHYDHMDLESLRQLAQQPGGSPQFFVPMGNESWFRENVPGVTLDGPQRNVFAMDWDDQYAVHGKTSDLMLHFVAVQHWSARTLWDRNETLWGSWALIHPRLKFWFSGDLGYSKDTVDIGNQFGGFDLAAIDIGSYEPRWFMSKYHVSPTESVQIMKDVHAKQAIGIHWGTFQLSDESLDQPPLDLAAALKASAIPPERFFVMHHGETRRFTEY